MVKHSRRANSHQSSFLERMARTVTAWTGSSGAFALALLVILVWGLTGPLFGFSDTWQLVINTGTTIVTFLMVFLIQRAQNKDALAIHLKLNEIVAAVQGASNRLINVEDLTEEEIRLLHEHYRELAILAKRESTLTQSHSIEEAGHRAQVKRRHRAAPVGQVAGPARPHEAGGGATAEPPA
jgi:low affinity Fe/Cu permease